MTERFTDSAVGTLAAGIDDTETTITLEVDAGSARFATPSGGDFQRATLYVVGDPDVFEIVHIKDNDGTNLTVQRGREGTTALAWDAGAKIGARITADMLESLKIAERGGTTPGDGFSFMSYPTLQDRQSGSTGGTASVYQDPFFGVEVTGGSVPVDLGSAVAWSGAPQSHLSVVVPTTPNGFQYWLNLNAGEAVSETSTEPTFVDDLGVTVAVNGDSPNDVEVGYWVPTELPIDITTRFNSNSRLVVTEVGFMVRSMTATTNPFVSIGTNIDATQFVNNQQLTQIAAAGQVHRFPITAGGNNLVEYLRFKVETAAAGGSFRGRFYWRGFFIDNSE